MGLTWKRNLKVVQDKRGKEYLKVITPPGGNPSDRKDSPNKVIVLKSDRKNGGARVVYTLVGKNGTLEAENKNARPSGFTVTSGQNKLTIKDGEGASNGVTFKYFVKLGDIKTKDPMIHNQADPRVKKGS